jgi:signal transduction histidine kinase
MARPASKPQINSPPADEPECISHPGVLARLLVGLGGSRAPDQEVRRLLFLDPTLSLHALRVIASIHPHATLTELDLPQLVETLGTHALKQLALADAVEQLLAGIGKGAGLDMAWRQAITTAMLSRALAISQGYRNPDEAWLAGLLTHLPAFVRNAASPEAARLACLAQLERIPLRSFLPDVLRFLDEPSERLRDAAPLVRFAIAAHRLLPGLKREPISPPADGVFLSQPLATDTLRDMLQNARNNAQQLTASIQPISPAEVAAEVVRFGRLEVAAGVQDDTAETAIAALASSLAAQEGLYDPIYLAVNRRTSTLESQPLGGVVPPPLSLRMEGSNTAAVRALFTRSCVVAYGDADDTALLDLQLIRQANAEGLAALPVGEGGKRGVLLICGDRDALEKLAEDPKYYTRLGELAGRAAPANVAVESAVPPGEEEIPARVRRAAHEVNNPLGIIKNYLAILKVKLGDDAPVADELRIIHEELDRVVRIVRTILSDEAEGAAGLDEYTDINALIEDMVKVTAPTWHAKGVQINTLLSPGLPRLVQDRDKLKQIVLNLLLNALEATPQEGTVRVETAAVTNQRRERYLEILVADSGPGIPAERLDTLFEPVQTQKGEDHAGLGLSIVKNLTESLNGAITFKSTALGTTFQISLPLGELSRGSRGESSAEAGARV